MSWNELPHFSVYGKFQDSANLLEHVSRGGDDHPDTLSIMSNLVSTYWEQGCMNEAAELEEEVLKKRKKILGHDHPDTLMSMANLAETYSQQGHTKEAVEL